MFMHGNKSMGFLKNFLKTNYRDGEAPHGVSSFRDLSEEQLDAHMSVARYGDFTLTDAVRPSYNLNILPQNRVPQRMVCRSGFRGSNPGPDDFRHAGTAV